MSEITLTDIDGMVVGTLTATGALLYALSKGSEVTVRPKLEWVSDGGPRVARPVSAFVKIP